MDALGREPAIHDERRGVRFPLPLKLQMQWGTPDASTARLPVWGLNISGLGAAFITDHPMPLAANVYLELPHDPAGKPAKVRNCKRWGAGWRVGVEFDLDWNKAKELGVRRQNAEAFVGKRSSPRASKRDPQPHDSANTPSTSVPEFIRAILNPIS